MERDIIPKLAHVNYTKPAAVQHYYTDMVFLPNLISENELNKIIGSGNSKYITGYDNIPM